jgi:mannitol/fructose-specific phosphotransferase system IIA component (Ntr-type)
MPARSVIEATTLADFTDVCLIEPSLKGCDAASVIQELGRRLKQAARVPDGLQFYHAALNREFLVSTAMENGLAFPHARLAGLDRLSFAFGRTDHPFAWGGRKTVPVRFVILTAVPATDATGYLSLLSAMARLGHEPQMLDRLNEAGDAEELLHLLGSVKLRAGSTARA